ncbi:MAG: sterol desaturase family protein [Bacteroidota bacterium]
MTDFQIVDFTDASAVILFTLTLLVIVFLRYVLVSGLFVLIFQVSFKNQFFSRKISKKLRPKGQSWREIRWSALTSFIFALFGLGIIWMFQSGYSAIYTDPFKYSIIYLPISLLVALFIHETYYYWLHRWMHWPKVYRIVHKIHHDSIVTSPWTAFSFDPIESILQAFIVPFIILLLPMHFSVVLLMLTIMTISATINHLDIEIYPAGFEKHWLGKWLVGATHHSQHHAKFLTNYGLYFTFWDKWMGTESPDFEALFKEKTKARNVE